MLTVLAVLLGLFLLVVVAATINTGEGDQEDAGMWEMGEMTVRLLQDNVPQWFAEQQFAKRAPIEEPFIDDAAIEELAIEALRPFAARLRDRRARLIKTGHSGLEDRCGYRDELTDLYHEVVAPATYVPLGDMEVPLQMEYWVDLLLGESPTEDPPRDGGQYETFCAKLLGEAGWQTALTPSTGDQGVDVLAQRDGRTIAIQCKRHERPVGNEAVQQIFSGMHFTGADEAVVVSPSGYTPAAHELADALGVQLITHDDLGAL